MTRLWFKDKSYMDAPDDIAKMYENDPAWDYSEILDTKEVVTNDDDVDCTE